jgi:hypothetical protein
LRCRTRIAAIWDRAGFTYFRNGGIEGATSSFGKSSGLRRKAAGYRSGSVFSGGSVERQT